MKNMVHFNQIGTDLSNGYDIRESNVLDNNYAALLMLIFIDLLENDLIIYAFQYISLIKRGTKICFYYI